MSATLACWEPSVGLNPESDDFDERFYAVQRARLPPSPKMLAFLEFLLARFPEYSQTASAEENEKTIWAAGPLIRELSGGFMHVAIRWKFYDEARLFIRPAARQFGLDFYDPQERQYIPADQIQ
ncbi:MAG TPA: hypothetical protein VL966_19715 [Alphaproteobacteria bacterium]|jgi:hypothetical protein|nr:hypothetical protein [Alphaproteobacteria bacterium]